MTCPKQSVDEHSKVPSSSSSKDVQDPLPSKHLPLLGHGEVQPLVGIFYPKDIIIQGDSRFVKEGQIVPIKPTENLSLEVKELDTPWSDLVLKDMI